jgi:outer membrane protein OmpA-like peptidoglycan-associated protein
MMRKIFRYIILCLLITGLHSYSFAQNAKILELMNSGNYNQAVAMITADGQALNEMSVEGLNNLGYAYIMLKQFTDAEPVYEELLSRKKPDPINHLYLGELQLINGKYPQAKQNFLSYNDHEPDNFKLQLKIAACDSIPKWNQTETDFNVKNLKTINSEKEEKSPKIINGKLVYVTTHILDSAQNAIASNSAYMIGKKTPELLFPEMAENYLCEALDYCPETDMYAFTLRKKTKFMYETGLSNAAIYFGKSDSPESLEQFGWDDMPEEINIAHPAFANKGSRLYFISDMSGGYGETDIWYSDKVAGQWQKPVNAGEIINTQGRELYPVYYNDSLYFSSDGFPGYGNLDVFLSAKHDGEWSNPINMKAPINSIGNDFSFRIETPYQGYFASNRSNASLGGTDIFQYNIPKPEPPKDPEPDIPEPEPWEFKPESLVLNPLFFESESAEIDEVYAQKLKQIADTLNAYPDLHISLTGHSDARGSSKYSEKLAAQRVQEVKHYLSDLGVNKTQISTQSAGITRDREVKGLMYHVQIGCVKDDNAGAWFKKQLNTSETMHRFEADTYYIYALGDFTSKSQAESFRKTLESETNFSGIVIASQNEKRLNELFYAPNRRVEMQWK